MRDVFFFEGAEFGVMTTARVQNEHTMRVTVEEMGGNSRKASAGTLSKDWGV